jgi:hypothetical protein
VLVGLCLCSVEPLDLDSLMFIILCFMALLFNMMSLYYNSQPFTGYFVVSFV